MYRYTDFLVNEIQLNGQVLHLTNTAVPVHIANKKSTAQQQRSNDVAKKETAGVAAAGAKPELEGSKTDDVSNNGKASNGEDEETDPSKVCLQSIHKLPMY